LLVKFYNTCAKEGKVEVVFVSSDRTVQSFNDYYQTMPWLAIPTDTGAAQIKANLAQALSVTGIPALFVLDVKTGNLVSSDARNEVSAVGDDKTKGRELIASWKEKETVPLDEIRAAQSSQEKGIGGMIIGLVLTM
jgi:nucleoredoxin